MACYLVVVGRRGSGAGSEQDEIDSVDYDHSISYGVSMGYGQ